MKPMTKKSRWTSLTILILVFLVLTPILVIYSLGYRISDINNVFTLERTGGIYVHSNISYTDVYLDDKYVKTNGVLLRNSLMQNLRPNAVHLVQVNKDGYNSWIKKLPVYSSLVTEARVLMIPKTIPKREIFPFISATSSTGTSTPPLKTPLVKGKPVPNNIEYRNTMSLFEGKDIYATSTTATKVITNITPVSTTTSTTTAKIPDYFLTLGVKDPSKLVNLIQNGEEISWLQNGNIILNWIGKNIEVPYYYCLLPENCRTQITLDWQNDILKFDFLPGRNDVFLAQVNSGLYAVEVDDRSDRNLQAIYTKPMSDFIIGPNNKIIIRDKDQFFELTI